MPVLHQGACWLDDNTGKTLDVSVIGRHRILHGFGAGAKALSGSGRQAGLSCRVHMERSFEPVGFINMTLNLSPAQAKPTGFSLSGQAFVSCVSKPVTLCEKIPTTSLILGF